MPIKITKSRLLFAIACICLSAASYSQNINELRLKDYRPVSIYKIPVTHVQKARFPVLDLHSHDYPENDAQVDEWVKTMDAAGIEKTVIMTYATGAKFDSAVAKYARYKDRFEIWCGFDYTGFGTPGWEKNAVKELERCYKKGARGVGELGDKGLGEFYSTPVKGYGMHVDNPQMKPLFEKCGQLKIPVSIHVAEDEWMYQPVDSTNDGLMNAAQWHVDMTKEGIIGHDELVKTLENVVKANPNTTFIACHLANCCSNLAMLGKMLDTYPNLYADIAARYGEIAPIPKFTHDFIEKYQDRLVYGTDMGTSPSMYHATFRILETADEHFYERDHFGYHWPLYGLFLSEGALRKIYHDNAKKIMHK